MLTIGLDLVSVIIPCYNADEYVADAITSVLEQTYSPIEIIVVNDGSTDNSEMVIRGFGDQVKYLYQDNAGVSAARNAGFMISKGQYVCFFDADDWFYPDNIERKINYLKQFPDVKLVHSIVEVTNQRLDPSGEYLEGKEGADLTQSLLNLELPIPCPSNVLMRRETLDEVGLFDTNLSTSADFELFLRIVNRYPAGMVKQVGIKYRRHNSNMFSNQSLFYHDVRYIYKKHARRLCNYNWNGFLSKTSLSLLKGAIKAGNPILTVRYMVYYLKTIVKKYNN